MRFSDAVKAIKARISLVDVARRYVELKNNGTRYIAPCPFHQETKPSFSINPEKGLFYCFGCHASGDLFDFYGKINGLDFRETLEQLARETGIQIESGPCDKSGKPSPKRPSARQMMLAIHAAAANHFVANLAKNSGHECRAYIQRRGLSDDIIERFGLGWAEQQWHSLTEHLGRSGFSLPTAQECGLLGKSASGNMYDRFRGRLIFPIKDLSNQIIAFGGRIIGNEDEAKYINSADTLIYSKKEHLYGLAQARRGITAKGSAILTEGYMDVLTLHQYGFDNGVGVLGTALTVEQIRRISGFASRIMLVFDGDRAGRKAALRSCEMLLTRGMACNVALLPDGEDIDSFLRSRGPGEFEKLMSDAPDGLQFCISALKLEAPAKAVEWAKNFLSHVQLPELVGSFASSLALRLNIAEDQLRLHLSRTGATATAAHQMPNAMRRVRNMLDLQIMIFAVRYPEKLDDLRKLGADMALSSPRAHAYWNLLEQWDPEEVIHHLDDQQKAFWFEQRGPSSPPLTQGEEELACLKRELANFYNATQKASLSAALADKGNTGDFETDLEYLRALQDTLEKGHEQS